MGVVKQRLKTLLNLIKLKSKETEDEITGSVTQLLNVTQLLSSVVHKAVELGKHLSHPD